MGTVCFATEFALHNLLRPVRARSSSSIRRRKRSSFRVLSVARKNGGVMLVSDLDFTMVDHKDATHSSLLNFGSLWEAEYSGDSHLVFSTGRSPEKYLELRKQVPLLTPETAILSVGTEICYGQSMVPDRGWEEHLDEGWNRDVIFKEAKKLPALKFQEESEQRPHKVSFKVEKKDAKDVIQHLSTKFKEQELDAKLIYSGGIDLDVLPQRAGKGQALAYLLDKARTEGWARDKVLVCGDSGNDIELFTVEGVNGVIVGNAHEELLKWYQSQTSNEHIHVASSRCAGGIMEALKVFELGPSASPREKLGGQNGSASALREVVEFYICFDKWLKGDVPDTPAAFERLTSVIAKGASMVYPWGVEADLLQSLGTAKAKHGVMKGKSFWTWLDRVKEHKLASDISLLTWESWEQSPGEDRRGYYTTAVLRAKQGTPNGFEWLRVHQTSRKP